jgi:hypothetical protein
MLFLRLININTNFHRPTHYQYINQEFTFGIQAIALPGSSSWEQIRVTLELIDADSERLPVLADQKIGLLHYSKRQHINVERIVLGLFYCSSPFFFCLSSHLLVAVAESVSLLSITARRCVANVPCLWGY